MLSASSVLPFVTACLAVTIFVVDTITNLEIAVAVFYVAVVLMSVSFCQRRGVLFISAGCAVLTVLSYFLTPNGSREAGFINSLISISAIGATTYLVLRIESAQIAIHEARAQLEHVSRITTLGELTVSIAHEVNQPLAAMATNGNACLRWLTAQPTNLDEAKIAAERIVEDAHRASEVIARIRGLAKQAPALRDHLNVNDLILDVIALVRGEAQKNRISLRTQFLSTAPPTSGDRVQLQQVVLNLIVNAIEAINATFEGPRELVISSTTNESGGIAVAVADTGTGVASDRLERLFDSFYSTKSDGMGMGLTISRSIVEAHGGRMWATPNSPRGLVVRFTLPIIGRNATWPKQQSGRNGKTK